MTKKYLLIYEKIREDIESDRLKAGEKLPSKRVCADNFNVSVISVEHAYSLLEEEGYIVAKEKRGYFVIYSPGALFMTPLEATINEPAKGKNIPRANEAFGFSSSIYAKTARKVLTEYGDQILFKSPSKGNEILRSAIQKYLMRNRKTLVSTEQIIIGAGAEYLYGLIVQAFGRNISYGIEDPSYQKIADVYKADGATIEPLRLGSDGIESSALWASNCKVLHITPYRSFPSGITSTVNKKMEYLKWSVEKDSFIIEDDFESEFTPKIKPEDTLLSLDKNERVIYVNTFTKTISPAIRIAYMIIPTSLAALFEEKIGFYSCPVPTLEQLIVATLIENGDFERHLNRMRRKNRKGPLY